MKHANDRTHRSRNLSRRDFVRSAGLAAAGLLAAGCQGSARPAQGQPPAAAGAKSTVATATAQDYDRDRIYAQVRDLLDAIGGLGDIVSSGDRVAIKVNLTGGTSVQPLRGVSAIESYITHPEVVRALGQLLRDAGARELLIVEAVYEWASYVEWGYVDIADAIGAQLIDLNDTDPYDDFSETAVGEGSFIYDRFTFNHVLEDVNAFVSVSKMKNHYCCGVTHTMKNLIGLVPMRSYRLGARDNSRTAFHGEGDTFGTRLPRVIMDLNRARPIHLGLIDGIKTTQGGEGPWIGTMSPIAPGVLIAGKDVVATDAVATAAMGYDPTIEPPNPPFLRSDNHLNLAYELGLGTNRLDEIEVVGPSIDDIKTKFEPCWD
ncbi:MAG: DUF362 domain-containing protein [Anaerolineae bacterium]|jgi:uncharacterized protein (DUF362 family)